MPRGKDPLVISLEIGCALRGLGAGELIVQKNRIGIINHPQSLLPKACAVIGFLVIGGFEDFVETTQTLPGVASGEQECARTIIHIPAEHVHRRERVVTAAIPEARSVMPYDASGFLECAVEQNQPAPDGADIRSAANDRQCRT